MHQPHSARSGHVAFGEVSRRRGHAKRRLVFEGLEPRQLLSVTPALLADLGGPGSSNPSAVVEVNGIGYFSADDGVHGRELWRTDGSPEGTYMLADIAPGPTGGMSAHMANLNGTLIFSANDGATGFELWKSDGTTQGTVLVADATPGPSGTSPVKLTAVGDLIFFSSGRLWRSDGTAEGTFKIGTAGSSPDALTNVSGLLFYSAESNGRDLWKSDGTIAGTTRVGYANGATNQQPRSLTNVAGTLYFTTGTSRTLWSSDGTAAGTKSLFGSAWELTNFNGTLYFSQGAKLYRRSGGSQPTLITDIAPGETTASISGFKAAGDKLFFAGSTNAYGQELWVTDGTNAGTHLVDDLVPGKSGIQPHNMVSVNGTLYFQITSNTWSAELGGTEVWKSDGTLAGTMRVKDIRPGSDGADVSNLRNVGGALYFSAEDSESGRELWISDGTDAGTQRILDINQQPLRASGPAFFTAVGATTFFSAHSLAHGGELWKTDGTEAGTVLVKDIKPGISSSSPRYLTNVNGLLFFVANSEGGQRLWRSDGTAEGTFAVTTSSVGLNVTLINANGTLYFASNGAFLSTSDGTVEGTHAVEGAQPLAPSYFFDNRIWGHFTAVGKDVYYIGARANESYWYVYELWKYEPVSQTHTKLAELNESPEVQQIFNLQAAGDLLYFETLFGDLWRTDGTPAGTQFLASADISHRTEWNVVDGRLYFGGHDPAFGTELWTSDGTPEGTRQVADLMPGSSGSDPTNLTAVGDRLFFSSYHSGHLWITDGTALGTHPIENTHGLAPEAITELDGRVYFRAGGNSDQLWTSDGSEDGTFLVAPIEISDGPAFVRYMANANGLLYFAGDDGVHGSEPWILAPPVAARLFYNNSAFDEVAGASGDADDAALAVDKLPYIRGNGRTTGENVSSYSKGINGLFIDLTSGHGEITADDFTFHMGTSTDPAGWSDAPVPISITVRAGAGIAGHDRVEIVFADDAIKNTWLEVTVRGNDARGGFHANTALDESSVFYFGSRVGDTFTRNSAAAAVTSAADALQIRAAGGTVAASGNRFDINRDGVVSAGDELLARFNSGILLMLELPQLIDPPASPAALAVTPAADPLGSAVVSALAGTLNRNVGSSAAASSHASELIDGVPATGPLRAIATAREAAAQFADEALLELTEGESLDETAVADDDLLLDALLSLS